MNLFPRQPAFFNHFEALAKVAKEGGRLLVSVNPTSQKLLLKHSESARKLELKGDNICHALYKAADSTFITPIDREDIHVLAQSLDNIIDHIENTISNLSLFRVKKTPVEYKAFTILIEECSAKVFLLVSTLKEKGRNLTKMKKLILAIHTYENQGDELLRKSLKSLFSNGQPAVEIIKWKDIYENMEAVLDECENTSDIVEQIIIKNF